MDLVLKKITINKPIIYIPGNWISTNKKRQTAIDRQSEQELLILCQQGDLKAFKKIYDNYSTLLHSVAMRMLGSKEDAEDAMQNCFGNLYRNIGQFKFQAKFSSYLVRILMNCCYDLLAKRKESFSVAIENPMDSYSPDEWSLSLEKAIAMLPLKMRECFILFAVEGFKQTEIAEMLELSEGTVKAHIFQAKTKLRQILQ